MGRKGYDQDMYDKLYDIIELIYILNRLSNNSYVDDRSKQYLVSMLDDVDSIKNNFDKYRVKEPYKKNSQIGYNSRDSYDYEGKDSIVNKIIFFLKSLNYGE